MYIVCAELIEHRLFYFLIVFIPIATSIDLQVPNS